MDINPANDRNEQMKKSAVQSSREVHQRGRLVKQSAQAALAAMLCLLLTATGHLWRKTGGHLPPIRGWR